MKTREETPMFLGRLSLSTYSKSIISIKPPETWKSEDCFEESENISRLSKQK